MKVVFTGGGSAGHVIPNLPIIDGLLELKWKIFYLGSFNGPEYKIIRNHNSSIVYFKIATDKFRRYFSLRTMVMPFIVFAGILQSIFYLSKIRPDVVFSKGGFVGLPVVISAKLLRIPVLSHESDLSPGLSNKMTMPFVTRLCVAAPLSWLITIDKKMVSTGIPLRGEIIDPNTNCISMPRDIISSKKILLVFGGSLGASSLNTIVWGDIDRLVERFAVVHITGSGNMNNSVVASGYYQTEFINNNFGALLSRADLVICRAGMTTIFELIAQKKNAILVPLPASSSRGDQIENATLMRKKGLFEVVFEDEFRIDTIDEIINKSFSKRKEHLEHLEKVNIDFSANTIIKELLKIIKND